MGAGRQAAGEEQAVAVGEDHDGAQQRVAGGGQSGGGDVGGGRGAVLQPVRGALEGVGGQFHPPGAAPGEDGVPVRGDSAQVEFGQGLGEPARAAVVAAQGAQGGGVGARVLDGLQHPDGEDRVRAALQEDLVAVREQGAGGLFEADGAAQVPVPVVGVQDGGVLQQGAADRGVEGDGGRTRGHPVQLGEQFRADVLDVGAVRGVVDGDAPAADVQGRRPVEEGVERVGVAGDDGGGGAVDGGDGEPAVPGGEVFGDLFGGQGHRGHAAASGQGADGPAAQGDDPCGVVQGEGSGDARGGDLALGVADDGAGGDAVGAPQCGEGDHDGPEHRLHHVDAFGRRGAGAPRRTASRDQST